MIGTAGWRVAVVAAAVVALMAAVHAHADEEWPGPRDRITLVVPFNAGGSADRMARALASFLPYELNDTPVTVLNKPGASGSLGATWFTRQPDDGRYFLVMQSTPYLANNILIMGAPIKWEDFHFINNQWNDYGLLMVHKDSRYRTLEDLIEDIRARPGEVSTGYVHASGAHLMGLILLDRLRIPRTHVRWVSYDGGGPARTAIAGGHVDFRFSAAEGTEVIRDFIRPLAVVRATRDKAWDAPPINEVLKAKYGTEVPLVGGNIISVIAHSSFKQKYPERYTRFVEAYRRTLERGDVQEFLKRSRIGGDWVGPERSAEEVNAEYEALRQYADLLKTKK